MKRRHGLVSVVLTSWNRKRYIIKCLNNLAAQTYKNIEIIIVDDGSSDGTQALIRKWRNGLKETLKRKIVFVPMPRNTGYSGALTTAMFFARGEFIATHDSDDFSHPNRIQKQVHYMRKHPDIGLVGSNYRVVRNGKILKMNPSWLAYGPQKIKSFYLKNRHCITCGSLLFRANVFDKFGGLNRRMDGAEDYEFVRRLSRNGVKMDNLPEVLYYVRQHDQQRSKKYYKS